jgi:Leucine-rich repeat (LRR) protein
MKYTLVLEDLKTAIANYDAIPYFCLNAYPQYSNDVVDENLEIINMKLDFQSENLEVRTEKFLEVSELDLSNTDFSLDLIFKGHENLEKLNLSNTQISSLKYLAETNIRWLDLSNTEIDRNDLEYLKYMENIEYLNLSNTGVRKKDIYDLCYHLKVKRKNCIAR